MAKEHWHNFKVWAHMHYFNGYSGPVHILQVLSRLALSNLGPGYRSRKANLTCNLPGGETLSGSEKGKFRKSNVPDTTTHQHIDFKIQKKGNLPGCGVPPNYVKGKLPH